MNDTNSVKSNKEEHFDVKKSILCQKSSNKDVLTRTDNGRTKVIRGAKLLDDQRILNRSTHSSFIYRLRPC